MRWIIKGKTAKIKGDNRLADRQGNSPDNLRRYFSNIGYVDRLI